MKNTNQYPVLVSPLQGSDAPEALTVDPELDAITTELDDLGAFELDSRKQNAVHAILRGAKPLNGLQSETMLGVNTTQSHETPSGRGDILDVLRNQAEQSALGASAFNSSAPEYDASRIEGAASQLAESYAPGYAPAIEQFGIQQKTIAQLEGASEHDPIVEQLLQSTQDIRSHRAMAVGTLPGARVDPRQVERYVRQ